MENELFENIKVSAYFLWEYTNSSNALNLWCCAEDISNFLAMNNVIKEDDIKNIIYMGKNNVKYINFVRNIAYRIHLYTGDCDYEKNWFIAERTLENGEWISAATKAANIFYNMKKDDSRLLKFIRSDIVRAYINGK